MAVEAISEITFGHKGKSVTMSDQQFGDLVEGRIPFPGQQPVSERSKVLQAAVRSIQRAGGPHLEPDEQYPAPDEGLFVDFDEPSGLRDFLPAPDLELIARELIEDDEALGHLQRYRVVYLWKRKGGQRQGQPVLGKCSKASGPANHYSDATWIVWLASDWARHYALTRQQVEAALHHELTHAGEAEIEKTDPSGETVTVTVPAVRGHDCEMFSSEIERYGLWRQPLKQVAPAFQQLDMFREQDDRERADLVADAEG